MPTNDPLKDDHIEVDRLFANTFAALDRNENVLDSIDLLWARLAVHVRAEHLHLFPTLLEIAEQRSDTATVSAIAELRDDHDLFMKKFAAVMKRYRAGVTEGCREALSFVADRLTVHNSLEERKVYPLAHAWLSLKERADLLRRITAELDNGPPRFARGWRPPG